MKRRIFSSVLAVIMIFSVTVFAASADSAVDLTGLTASDSTVNFHINEIYSKIDVLEYRSLSEVVAYSNALRSAAENDTAASDIAIEWNGTVYGLEEFCDEIVFPVIPMGSGARSMADAVMDDDTLWPFGTSVKDPSQTVYDSAAYAEVYDLWKHLRDDHKDGFLPVSEFVTEKAQLEAKIRALTAPVALPTFKVASASLSLGESIAINFKVNADVYTSYENVYGIAVCDGDVARIEGVLGADGKYAFSYSNLTPNMAKVPVTFTLYGTGNGQEYTKTVSYSIYKYCQSLYKISDDSVKTFIVDFLNYAAALQEYTDYNVDDLANVGFDQSYASATLTAPVNQFNGRVATIDNPTVAWKGIGLTIEDVIKTRVKFQADDITGLSIRFTINGTDYNVTEFTPVEGTDNQYYAFFGEMLPNEMRTTFTFTAYRDGVAVSNTAQYSIQSYAAQVGVDTTTALGKVLDAMLKYGDSCAVAFG